MDLNKWGFGKYLSRCDAIRPCFHGLLVNRLGVSGGCQRLRSGRLKKRAQLVKTHTLLKETLLGVTRIISDLGNANVTNELIIMTLGWSAKHKVDQGFDFNWKRKKVERSIRKLTLLSNRIRSLTICYFRGSTKTSKKLDR